MYTFCWGEPEYQNRCGFTRKNGKYVPVFSRTEEKEFPDEVSAVEYAQKEKALLTYTVSERKNKKVASLVWAVDFMARDKQRMEADLTYLINLPR